MFQKYEDVFIEDMSEIKEFKAKLRVKANAIPRFHLALVVDIYLPPILHSLKITTDAKPSIFLRNHNNRTRCPTTNCLNVVAPS